MFFFFFYAEAFGENKCEGVSVYLGGFFFFFKSQQTSRPSRETCGGVFGTLAKFARSSRDKSSRTALSKQISVANFLRSNMQQPLGLYEIYYLAAWKSLCEPQLHVTPCISRFMRYARERDASASIARNPKIHLQRDRMGEGRGGGRRALRLQNGFTIYIFSRARVTSFFFYLHTSESQRVLCVTSLAARVSRPRICARSRAHTFALITLSPPHPSGALASASFIVPRCRSP